MTRSVALLRGINLGGRRKVAMPALRTAFEAAGATDVTTYIQSGNVVFTPPPRHRGATLETHLEAQLRRDLDMDVPVLVRTAAELDELVAHNPFPGPDGTKIVVWFVRSPAEGARIGRVDTMPFAPERLEVRGREIYLDLPGGQARSPLLAALGKVRPPVDMTARNWNTVRRLHELAHEAD